MHIGYKRVSTKEQSAERQLSGIKLDREPFIDYISGAKRERPALELCLLTLREGDVLHVHSPDRLARSFVDSLYIVERVLNVGADIIIHSPYTEFSADKANSNGRLMFGIFSLIAEWERSLINTRSKEGSAIAREKGTRSGKPWGNQPLDMTLAPKAIELLESGMPISHIAKTLCLSRSSIYKLLSGHTKVTTY